MIDGSKKRNRQLAFALQNSHVCEKRSNYGTSFRLYHPSDFVTWQTTSVQALYLIKFLENFHSQNIIERNTIEEMTQNLFTILLHKTICVVMSAGVIIAYDTEKLSFKCYMITSGLKVAISHLKKWHFPWAS